jgi:hypothetical protein
MFAEELQHLFIHDRERIQKTIGGYIAGYAMYSPKKESTRIQIFVDPRKRTDRRYTFSAEDISAPVMRLDYEIYDEKLYEYDDYSIEAALTQMEEFISVDLNRYEDHGYEQ